MKTAVLFAVLVVCLLCCGLPTTYSQGTRTTYDFIIVGAGTAGSAVTGELSKKCKQCSFLLIEAGGDATDPVVHNTKRQFEIFGANFTYLRDDHHTVPAPNYFNHEFHVSRGMMTGGSMGVNAMFYVVGDPWEWDTTSQDLGDDNWNWKKTDKFRKQIEKEFSIYTFDDDQVGGPQYIAAFNNAGWNYDTNTKDGIVGLTSAHQVARLNPNQPGGIRETSYDNKVLNAKNDNIEVITFHRVAKVLIDSNKKAYGVRVINLRSGFEADYFVNKEVILSAGAFRTPQILQLSGVGPQALLQQHGIDVVLDAPGVGANLNDHIGLQSYWESLLPSNAPILYDEPNFLFFGPRPAGQGPQFQMEVASGFISLYPLRRQLGGTVQIASADPLDQPIVTYPVTTDYEDAIVQATQNILLPAVQQLQALNVTGVGFTPIVPGATDEDIRGWLRDTMATNFHVCGSVRVGHATDNTSPLDSHFRVKGIQGLRVVDASAHRYMPSGNINAPTLLLGYLAADIINKDIL